MTQATVNAGNSAVKNLNPNAQQFSSSDCNNGTVLTGSVIPSDESYGVYHDQENGHYVRQHQSQVYTDDSTPMCSLQRPDSVYSINDHRGGTHFPATVHQMMPDNEAAQTGETTAEDNRERIRYQLTYYFSEKNILQDKFLKSNMDSEDYVSIAVIANFNLVRKFTNDLQLITDVLKEIPSVEVDAEEKNVRSKIVKTNRLAGKRCIIILRDVPYDATDSEIEDLFTNEQCPVRAAACERVLGAGKSDCWYVTFNSEDDAQYAFLYLTRENVSIRGQKVLARMKAQLRQMSTTVSMKTSSTPVSPPIQNNGGATSPPPSTQQTVAAYPTGNFSAQQQPSQVIQQQQQQQQLPPPPPQQQQPPVTSIQQYSSQIHQPTYNHSQMHGSIYMATTPNQTALAGNFQASTGAYRHPIHSPMGQAYASAQYSSNNQTQHPQSIDPQSSLSHIRMAYPNYSHNITFDRPPWSSAAGSHQPSVQNSQPPLSFASATPPPNMSSYTSQLHQPHQFLTNPGVLPGSFFYLQAPNYQNSDYSAMSYNGTHKPKPRTPREHPTPSKLRNSGRPPLSTRNPRPEGLPMTNEHINELDYGQHSTPHSEGSSSPVPRVEVSMNRPNDASAVPIVTGLAVQHIPSYASNQMDPSASIHDHYPSHPSNEIDFTTKTNSHPIQQHRSSDVNISQEPITEPQNLGKYSPPSSHSTTTSNDNAKPSTLNYQPLEQRKVHLNPSEQAINNTVSENQPQATNKKTARPSTTNEQQTSTSIPPLMPPDNRTAPNKIRSAPSSQQTARVSQQQNQIRTNSSNNHPNSSTPLSVTIPKVASVASYKQNSPQSPNPNQKNQPTGTGSTLQQVPNDNSGPRSYADTLKIKQAPQKQSEFNKSSISPPNETNDLSSSRAESPAVQTKIDSVSTSGIASLETNGPSSPPSELSPTNLTDASNVPSSASVNNDSNLPRRNSSTSDHPQQQHSSSPSHQQYNNSRGRGGRGGNYRYANDRRSGANNGLNRGGRGGGRRPMNNNNVGSHGPPPYQSRGSGGRGNGRFFDRSRGGGNYHNSNQTVHRFTGNTGNVEPQVHYTE